MTVIIVWMVQMTSSAQLSTSSVHYVCGAFKVGSAEVWLKIVVDSLTPDMTSVHGYSMVGEVPT